MVQRVDGMPSFNDIQIRTPLFRDEFLPMYRRILEHPHGPAWNALCGDRLEQSDLEKLQEFERGLSSHEPIAREEDLDTNWKHYLEAMALRSPYFAQSLERGLHNTGSMRRKDLIHRLHEIVPLDADLSRLVINPTSGTTGMPVQVPNDPLGVGHYQPLILEAIRRCGVDLKPGTSDMAAVQICAQTNTMTYGTVHSAYAGAGFAKINLPPGGEEALLKEWPSAEAPSRFLNDLQPMILSGDPFAFRIYMDFGIPYRPQAVLSTASTLSAELRKEMEEYFRCPVVDFYSTNETGPIASNCPKHPQRFHLLSPDIRLELLDSFQTSPPAEEQAPEQPVPQERGNTDSRSRQSTVHITGGRNPLLPLLRYDTGDVAVLSRETCDCGIRGYLTGLQGRPLIVFRDARGQKVNPLDFARILRFVPARQHRLVQQADASVDIYLDPGPFDAEVYSSEIKARAKEVLGGADIRIHPWKEELYDTYPYRVME